MKRQVLPGLPGRWAQLSSLTVHLPHRHMAWIVVRSVPSYGGLYLSAVAMPLFTWSTVLDATIASRPLGGRLPHPRYFSREEAEALVEESERSMTVIVDMVLSEAVPHFECTARSVSAYLRQLRLFRESRSSDVGNGHSDDREAACHLLLGDAAGARAAYQRVLQHAQLQDGRDRAISVDGRPVTLPDRGRPEWLQDLVDTAEKRLALSDADLLDERLELLRVEDAMRAHWRFPEPEQIDPGVGLL